MLVVLPVCGKDEHLAKLNLDLCKSWGRVGHDAVVSVESGYDPAGIVEAAKDYFSRVHLHTYPKNPYGPQWPRPHNWAFTNAAAWVWKNHSSHWLWWEQDAVPLKASWLDELDAAYREGKRPFAGFRQQTPNQSYLAGVAIYPHDAVRRMARALRAIEHPFDVAGSVLDGVLRYTTEISHILKHNYRGDGSGDTFTSLSQIPPELVLWHRCEDGSLQKLLNSLASVETAKPEPPTIDLAKSCHGGDCVVQLGRLGDIINILPIAKHIYDTEKQKLSLVVQAEFADVLDGVSYVEPLIWEGSVESPTAACKVFSEKFDRVFCAQLFGQDLAPYKRDCANFAVKQWQQLGWETAWNKLSLVFDRRNLEREQILLDKIAGPPPYVGLSFVGKSGPFDKTVALRLRKALAKALPNVTFVDFAKIQANKPFDLLGVMDMLDCLITVDTLHLHLARASKVPVISFIRDGWHGAHNMPVNRLMELPYSKVESSIDTIVDRTKLLIETTNKPRLVKASTMLEARESELPLHIFTLVLDGAWFILRHFDVLRRLKIPWHWVIVEGTAKPVNETGWCRNILPRFSRDGTHQLLKDLAHHPNITVLQRKSWNGKLEMVNAALPCKASVLLQMDCDEFWAADQLEGLVKMFWENAELTSALFDCNYFVGPDLEVVGKNCWGHGATEWRRAWRFAPGAQFNSHEPPVLTTKGKEASQDFARKLGLTFNHYAYVTKAQVKFKENYYGYAGAVEQWEAMQSAAETGDPVHKFLKWVPKSDKGILHRTCSII